MLLYIISLTACAIVRDTLIYTELNIRQVSRFPFGTSRHTRTTRSPRFEAQRGSTRLKAEGEDRAAVSLSPPVSLFTLSFSLRAFLPPACTNIRMSSLVSCCDSLSPIHPLLSFSFFFFTTHDEYKLSNRLSLPPEGHTCETRPFAGFCIRDRWYCFLDLGTFCAARLAKARRACRAIVGF